MAISVLNVPFLSGTDKFQEGMLAPGQYLQQQLANQLLGTQAKYAEPLTRNDLLAKELQNRISQVKANFAEPTAEEELKQLQQYNKYYGIGQEADIAHKNALTQRLNAPVNQQEMPGNFNFTRLPKPSQKAYIDQIIAMGYTYPEAIQHAYAGTDFGELAEQKGYRRDLSDVPKSPSELTGATKTQLARSNMAKAGLDAADETINKGIAHYSGQPTIHGAPVGFYKDAIFGKNKDKQSDFIASTVLAQDQAFLRARQAGAPLSQGLLKHTLETTLTDVKGNFAFTSPEVFQEAAKKIKNAFDEINAAENKAAYASSMNQTKKSKNASGKLDYSKMSIEELQKIAGY